MRGAKLRTNTDRSRVAIIDESTPVLGDGAVLYSMAAVHLTSHELESRLGMVAGRLNRRRPFHWEREGPHVRELLISALVDVDARLVCAAMRCAGRGQANARQEMWRELLLPDATRHAVGHLIIEGRSSAENLVDQRTVRDWCRDHKVSMIPCTFIDKTNPGSWLADAAVGAWTDTCLGRVPHSFRTLFDAGLVRQLTHWA